MRFFALRAQNDNCWTASEMGGQTFGHSGIISVVVVLIF